MRNETKINKEITVIDTFNIDYSDWYDEFKEYCEINHYELKGKGDNMEGLFMGGKITFFEWVQDIISEDTLDFWSGLRRVKESEYNDYYVVTGSLGLWYGRKGGICETFNNLYDALSKCATDAYDIIVKCDGKKIDFDCMHHDGTNSFTIFRLSYDDYDKIEWWDDDKDGNVFDFIKKHAKPICYEMLGL